SAYFLYYSRMVTMDSLLTLWVTLALSSAHWAVFPTASSPDVRPTLRWGWWVMSAIACGLGVLTKGPVAVVLTTVPLFLVQAIDPRMARPRLVPWAVFGLVSVSVTVPWFAMAMARQEDFGEYFFWRHNIVRFVAPFDHEGPPWYYLPGLLVGLLPAALLLPG